MKRLLALSLLTSLAMFPAAAQVSDVPTAGPLTGSEAIPVVQTGALRQTTATSIAETLTRSANIWAGKQTFPVVNLPLTGAPISPVDGDVWATQAGLFARIAGATVGPMAGLGNAQTWPAQQFFGSGMPTSNWLKDYAYGDNAAALVALNTSAGGGVTGAARTSTAGAGNIGIGGIFWGFTDGSGATASNEAWGSYHECRAYPGTTGFCEGVEIDATNLRATTAESYPYAPFPTGMVGGLHIATGGKCYNPTTGAHDLEAIAADHAILITTNLARFKYGVGFGCGSIGTTDCAGNGAGDAIRLYGGLNLRWFAPNNASQFAFGTAAGTTLAGTLSWSNSGLVLQNGAGANLFQFYPGASDVNGALIRSAAASAAPSLAVQGTDTNVSLNLVTKGNGTLQVNGKAGVSCAAGAVSLSTLVITNGLVTHC